MFYVCTLLVLSYLPPGVSYVGAVLFRQLLTTVVYAQQYGDIVILHASAWIWYQVITACGHKVGWLIAKKSFDRLVPGFFARALSGIPVVRPQVSFVI